MWLWISVSTLLILLVVLIRQRWNVTSEWLRMERELSEEEYELWRQEKERKAEDWSERWKNVEAGLLMLFAIAMFSLWFFI